jgi:hypothetical protein
VIVLLISTFLLSAARAAAVGRLRRPRTYGEALEEPWNRCAGVARYRARAALSEPETPRPLAHRLMALFREEFVSTGEFDVAGQR